MKLDDLPDAIDLEIEVAVSGDVSESVDRSPANLRMSRLDLRWEPVRRLGERLEPPENGILDVEIVEESISPLLSPLLDQADRLADVDKEATVTFATHNATASRRICSAPGEGRLISMTSTRRPSAS